MGMTLTQKILAAHAGLAEVKAGQLINAKLDIVLGNDITTPVAIAEFNKAGLTQGFDREKIALVLDHYTPCKDIKAAQLCKLFACFIVSAVDEIRSFSATFKSEVAKCENSAVYHKFYKFFLVGHIELPFNYVTLIIPHFSRLCKVFLSAEHKSVRACGKAENAVFSHISTY